MLFISKKSSLYYLFSFVKYLLRYETQVGLTSTEGIYRPPCELRQRVIMDVGTTGWDQMRLKDRSGFPAKPLSATFQF